MGVPLKVPVEDMVQVGGNSLIDEPRESSYYILSLPSSLFTAPGLGYAKAQGPILVTRECLVAA